MSLQIDIATAVAGMDLEQLRDLVQAAAARPCGTFGLGIERIPTEGRPDRFLVVQYRWSGNRWLRYRRLSGLKSEAFIIAELESAARRLGHPIIGAMELQHA